MKGSILKRGKNRYLIRIWIGTDPITGKDLRPGKTIHGSKKQAEKALREWIDQYESGQLVTAERMTLNQHIAEWLEVSLRPSVEPRTFEAYKYDLDRFVTHTLGRLPISKIRPYDVQSLYVDLVKNGTGPSSVKRLHAPMSRLFRQAVAWQRITVNPTIGIQIPKRDQIQRRKPKPMTAEQALRFLDAAGETPWLALFELALSSGMRPGEYLGLGWDCVDWDGHRVRVERAVKRPRKGEPYLGPPKTKKSRRTIPVPPNVLESLREHRLAQNTQRLRVGERWESEHNLVFPNSTGGILDEANFNRLAFRKVQKIAGLKGFNPYSLRHTCATLLLLADVNPKIVSERLGHSTISQTLDTYSHVLPTMQKVASERLDQLLFQTV